MGVTPKELLLNTLRTELQQKVHFLPKYMALLFVLLFYHTVETKDLNRHYNHLRTTTNQPLIIKLSQVKQGPLLRRAIEDKQP